MMSRLLGCIAMVIVVLLLACGFKTYDAALNGSWHKDMAKSAREKGEYAYLYFENGTIKVFKSHGVSDRGTYYIEDGLLRSETLHDQTGRFWKFLPVGDIQEQKTSKAEEYVFRWIMAKEYTIEVSQNSDTILDNLRKNFSIKIEKKQYPWQKIYYTDEDIEMLNKKVQQIKNSYKWPGTYRYSMAGDKLFIHPTDVFNYNALLAGCWHRGMAADCPNDKLIH